MRKRTAPVKEPQHIGQDAGAGAVCCGEVVGLMNREIAEARAQIEAALKEAGQISDPEGALMSLFATAGALAKTLPLEKRLEWAQYAYEIADDLASPDVDKPDA